MRNLAKSHTFMEHMTSVKDRTSSDVSLRYEEMVTFDQISLSG